MNERLTDEVYIKGDFKKATTSPSQTALQNNVWFIKYPLKEYLGFLPENPSISFNAGSKVHDYFQGILTNIFKIEDVQKNFDDFIKITPYQDKQKEKAKIISKQILNYVQNHLQAIKDISGNKFDTWKVEKFFSEWFDDVYMGKKLNIATEGYIDCYNDDLKIITEHKNRFGSVYYKGDKLLYRSPNKIKSPQFTHCMQVAVYSKICKDYKPFLIYSDHKEYTVFDSNNCWELSANGLKYFFRKFIQINIQRQEMLRMADGSIKKLAMMIGVDWSEIRNWKNNNMLENMQEEDIKKMEDFYENL